MSLLSRNIALLVARVLWSLVYLQPCYVLLMNKAVQGVWFLFRGCESVQPRMQPGTYTASTCFTSWCCERYVGACMTPSAGNFRCKVV